jgi:hypothetical protein
MGRVPLMLSVKIAKTSSFLSMVLRVEKSRFRIRSERNLIRKFGYKGTQFDFRSLQGESMLKKLHLMVLALGVIALAMPSITGHREFRDLIPPTCMN